MAPGGESYVVNYGVRYRLNGCKSSTTRANRSGNDVLDDSDWDVNDIVYFRSHLVTSWVTFKVPPK